MIRPLALFFCFAATAALAAAPNTPTNAPASPAPVPIAGVVADPTGAIVPNAEIDLVDATGAVAGTFHSGADGSFQVQPPHTGSFTLVVSEPGFETTRMPVVAAAPAAAAKAANAAAQVNVFPVPLHVVLPIAALSTNVHVSAESNEDLTSSDSNHDTSVMTAADLKQLPIFDNDYATAMSAFMDDSATATGGAGLIVDGVESGRATVSASAVQEVRINQDPYSAQYYWPGRGQMEIITKSAADHYHGQFNFIFRDNSMNAQNALAPDKPYEQRRVYEGHVTGPILFAKNSSFLGSFNRAEEDANAVIDADVMPTPENPTGVLQQNVAAPNRDTEFSLRAAHKFSDSNSAYMQYAYQDWNGQNQGVGGQTLAEAGYNGEYHEDDFTIHSDSMISPVLINQFSVVAAHAQNTNANTAEAPRIYVNGYYNGGSAQNDSFSTAYNFRLFDTATWTRGRHFVKMGVGIPNLARRAFNDNTNSLGSYSYAPTLDANGNVLASALDNYNNHLPSGFSQGYGDVHYIYHQQEAGAFIQDQIKVTTLFSITPGLRYDWLNFLAQKRLGFSPRVSFAYVLDQQSKTVIRGGGGLYYDRFGSGPMLDLVRYEGEQPRRRTVSLSMNPATQPADGCYPISNCYDVTTLPVNRVELAPDARLPYQMQYGISIERGLGEKATITASAYSTREIGAFRSVDINAPTPESGYTVRPDPNYLRIREMQPAGFFAGDGMDISYQGRFNKWFSGWGRYTWSHYGSNTSGINWYPQNQYAPNDEWGPANWDRRNRLGFYGAFNPKSVFNLSGGIFANSGTPWTITTGTDPYGDALFNARPDGVTRNSENLPPYLDLDLRWGHDWALTADKDDEAPHLGFSASSFNILNHPSVGWVDTVETSPTFGEETSVSSPRRIQLAMRFEF
jgi:Carboxypeptidase regulatory-like domain